MTRRSTAAIALIAAGVLAPGASATAWAQAAQAFAKLRALERASGAPLRVSRSRTTGLPVFIRAERRHPIPLDNVSAAAPAADRARAFVEVGGPAFGLAGLDEVAPGRVTQGDEAGMDHVRFQQVHQGVPVRGGELIVHLRGGGVAAANGRILPEARTVETTPSVAPAAALAAAAKLLAYPYDPEAVRFSSPRLEILNAGFLLGMEPAASGSAARLAWFIETTAPGRRDFVWIDAHDASVLLQVDHLVEARNRRVYDANNGWSLPGTLVRAEGWAATGDTDTDSAYDYAGDTYDYYFTQHGRDSYDNAGAALLSSVHYCEPTECPYANAAWDGVQMIYGEGFSRADDVVAHELTHAVIEREANLIYCLQSGALNESYADILGETIDLDNAAGTDTPGARWLLGEDLPGIGAVRNMANPNSFGDPGKVSDPQFVCAGSCADPDNGGVHSNSGVPNHAFALMADGGTYNDYTVAGIGLAKAAKIQYRALTQYLTAAASFADNYDALNQSCTDLVGIGGITAADCEETTKALDAVEMGSVVCGAPSSCGDGNLDPGEQCDDGDRIDGNGCDSNCTPTGCGNGVVTAGEACDDGNAVDGDGCEADCSLTPGCAQYVAADVPIAIPDRGSATSELTVNEGGRITNVQIVGLGASHTWVGDLDFTLRSPSGTEVTVVDRICSREDAILLSLADWAAGEISCPPDDGQFHKPSNPLAAFNGAPARGQWSLTAADRASLDAGTLTGWTLKICTAATCEETPAAGCRTAGRNVLRMRDGQQDSGDSFSWRWLDGQSTSQAEFGTPAETTPYALCLYDAVGLVLDALVPPGGMCGEKPCWSALGVTGYQYADRTRANSGVRKLRLAGSDENRARIIARGSGRNLPFTGLQFAGPVRIQLVNRTSGACFESAFGTPFVRNDEKAFVAVSP